MDLFLTDAKLQLLLKSIWIFCFVLTGQTLICCQNFLRTDLSWSSDSEDFAEITASMQQIGLENLSDFSSTTFKLKTTQKFCSKFRLICFPSKPLNLYFRIKHSWFKYKSFLNSLIQYKNTWSSNHDFFEGQQSGIWGFK